MKTRVMARIRRPWGSKTQGEAGLTLLEALMAIIVVALALSAATPALILTVGTRVQSQRAEQALALAQSQVDRVRQIVERGEVGYTAQVNSVAFITTANELKDAPVPTSFVAAPNALTQARLVDLDGNSTPDFAVQIFRTAGYTPAGSTSEVAAFDLGVRVYAADADQNALQATAGRLGTTTSQGSRREQPLAVLYTTIARSETGDSLCGYQNFIDSTASTGLECP
ncbi:MAG: type II secretion system protein [Leptolyngbyaceae cyanobacterium T60_A2020_046]|nr:type II secretion system protein [Leptolyngbyaceae cyanobacterium T60_A2020_046]